MSSEGVVNLTYHTYKSNNNPLIIYPGNLLEIKCISNENNHQGPKFLKCSYDGTWSESSPRVICGYKDVDIITM